LFKFFNFVIGSCAFMPASICGFLNLQFEHVCLLFKLFISIVESPVLILYFFEFALELPNLLSLRFILVLLLRFKFFFQFPFSLFEHPFVFQF